MLEPNTERLERILQGIYEHGGATTLHKDWMWFQEVQREKPEWAAALLAKYHEMHTNR